jgi:hypothetical protein
MLDRGWVDIERSRITYVAVALWNVSAKSILIPKVKKCGARILAISRGIRVPAASGAGTFGISRIGFLPEVPNCAQFSTGIVRILV